MAAITTAPDVTSDQVARSWLRHDVLPLYRRSLRALRRVPSALIPPLFMPVFFLVVNTAALGNITDAPVFQQQGIDNYVAFFVPVSLLMTVASVGSGSGMALVQDIDAGYFDKLLLAPISRTAVLLSRLMVDGTRAAAQATLILLVSLFIGGKIEAGIIGALMLIAIAFLFGLAYAGISLTIALRTGSAEATQASFIIFFPLVFLAPTFVPVEFLPGWLQAVVAVNPVTYVIEGMRGLTVHGFRWGALLLAVLAIGAIGLLTMVSAFRALKVRTNQ